MEDVDVSNFDISFNTVYLTLTFIKLVTKRYLGGFLFMI